MQIEGLRGTTEKPIVIRPFPGERAIFDGTNPIQNRWSRHQENIWKTTLEHDIWQLFCGDKLVHVARWPNASLADGSIWRMDACMRSTDRKFVRGRPTGQTKDGLIYDRNPASLEADPDEQGAESLTVTAGVNPCTLAESGVDFSGAIAVLNLHHWLTWARPITDHEAGRNWFRYDSRGTEMEKYVAYYILGLPALDRPNEWWYDVDTKTVYFCPPDDGDPNTIPISAKVRDYSLRLIDCSHVVIQSLDFFASTFSMTDCQHTVVEDGSLLYPSTNRFVLGDYSWFDASSDPDRIDGRRANAKDRGNVLTRIVNHNQGPHRNVIRNCEIAFANSPAIVVNSPGSIVENCYIHDIEWDLNSSGGSGSLPGGAGCIIRRNTIHTAGNSEGIRPGPGSIVEYNRLWNMGNLQFDGSAINIGMTLFAGEVHAGRPNVVLILADDVSANLIEYLDKLVGKLIAKAEELDIYEETYFIFCADNGTAVTAKDRGVERGVHVPYVVKGPGVTRRGITDELTDFADIAPTLLDMAGIEHPDGLRTTRI